MVSEGNAAIYLWFILPVVRPENDMSICAVRRRTESNLHWVSKSGNENHEADASE